MTDDTPYGEYGDDVLATPRPRPRAARDVVLRRGLVVEVLDDGFVGEVVAATATQVHLRDRRGRTRMFGLDGGGFLVDDHPARLRLPPRPAAADHEPTLTRSGSIAVPEAPARVARASRIYVEGVHDAELLERVWGDDLRVEGVVVEVMDGIDDLAALVARFAPGPDRRLGVLVDHLVPGTKEHRIAATVRHPHVLVAGHDFVDVWAAVRPAAAGIDAWPEVPMGTPWKEGVVAALGVQDPPAYWKELLGRVQSMRDLEHSLTRAVEQLIDFVTDVH